MRNAVAGVRGILLPMVEWIEPDGPHSGRASFDDVAPVIPVDTEYRLREFAFVDADGTLHRVGSQLR